MNPLLKLITNKKKVPLNIFIEHALYHKQFGYYEKKNIFGRYGDFTTAPIVSSIFSEMLSIWIVSFWIHIGKPKEINVVELGPGLGIMAKDILKIISNMETFDAKLNFILFEKSERLKKKQAENLKNFSDIFWTKNIKTIKPYPTIFLANEFFDSLPIKQFIKVKNQWFERYVVADETLQKFNFFNQKINENIENQISKFYNLKKSDIIEFPDTIENYLVDISSILKKNSGILLIADYGYSGTIGHQTLRGFINHAIVNVLKYAPECDITHSVNFSIIEKIFKKLNIQSVGLVEQSFFLKKLGILERLERVIKQQTFLKSKNIFLSVNKLLNPKEMGDVFKVSAYSNSYNNFILGFK